MTAPDTRCDAHRLQLERDYDKRRETQGQRGYNSKGHRQFRRRVLDRDPVCVICGDIATDADHHPRSRRDLIAAGENPNDPRFGRGLCHSCHSKQTAVHQPGGWNRR